METHLLQEYYNKKQEEYKSFLENERKELREANLEHLSATADQACKDAEKLLEESNRKAFERFEKSKAEIEQYIKGNFPKEMLTKIIDSKKKDLERSLDFNQALFKQSTTYYRGLVKS